MAIYRSTWTISHPALGGTGTNTWHIDTESAASAEATDMVGATAWIKSFYETIFHVLAVGTIIHHDGTWTSVSATPIVNGTSGASTVTGAGGTGVMAPQDCLVATWRTAVANRRGRGRTFVGPLANDAIEDNGSPNESIRATLAAAGASLISDMNAGDGSKVGVYSVADNVLRPFVTCTVRNKFGTLRSRRD